jgi:hypothetical protein
MQVIPRLVCSNWHLLDFEYEAGCTAHNCNRSIQDLAVNPEYMKGFGQ